MTLLRYIVRIDRDPGCDWGASVPDLPGCVATGMTLDTALRRIRAPVAHHLAGMREDGRLPPRPRSRIVLPDRRSRSNAVYTCIEVAA